MPSLTRKIQNLKRRIEWHRMFHTIPLLVDTDHKERHRRNAKNKASRAARKRTRRGW